MNEWNFMLGVVIFIIAIFIIRLFGSWMLRINEVISNQEAILAELQKSNSQKGIE